MDYAGEERFDGVVASGDPPQQRGDGGAHAAAVACLLVQLVSQLARSTGLLTDCLPPQTTHHLILIIIIIIIIAIFKVA